MRLLALLLIGVLLGACGPASAPNEGGNDAGISVAERLSAQPQAGFLRADRPRRFEFPADHGAHPDYATEWWYFTGNLTSGTGRRFGYQLTLFRIGLVAGQAAADSPLRSNQVYMGHLAISDIQAQRHYSRERFSRSAAGLAGAESVPLKVWLGSWHISGEGQGREPFPLTLRADSDQIAIEMTLQQGDKPRILQGERGWSRKGAEPGNASYYYSHTRLPGRGRLRIGEQWYQVAGDSWFDREWSSSALGPDQAGWDWFSLQLNDGRELMFYRMRDRQGHAQRYSQGVLVGQRGQTTRLDLDNTQLQANRYRRSEHSGIRYPLGWRLQVPTQQIDLQVDAALDDQEMNHSVRYWEGAVNVSGSHRGVGYLEMSGYSPPNG